MNSVDNMLKPKDYKSGLKPVWCPGCGDFAVLSALSKALSHLQLRPENIGVISGIGCSSRLPAYLSSYGFHGIHGRALPIATGLKVARPELTVIATGGDGDGFSIGGNHFLHACRRNLDMTYIVMDNEVYGMTKGQASPTTQPDWATSKLTPHGTGMRPFHPAAIALASGASFIARAFSGDPNGMAQLIVQAIQHKGFSFIQALSPCPTYRPEQKQWKNMVEPYPFEPSSDTVEAAGRIHADSGLTSGLIFQADYPVWQANSSNDTTVKQLSEDFIS
ncbi:MAG: 2-oxoacid:ferredoxin oxidoreductase subunit beta [Gammaproteobacteria bacterium]|nr:2-oxoacid:ferredoxin oxidoreductase subunit beta [Gammaproteobacteria bacterium]